jgi:hypothetical protein
MDTDKKPTPEEVTARIFEELGIKLNGAGRAETDENDDYDGGALNVLAPHDIGNIARPPPRGLLLGNQFARGFLSSLIAPGAIGKTSLRIADYLSCASGKSLTGHRIHKRCRVLLLCFEDDIDELEPTTANTTGTVRVACKSAGIDPTRGRGITHSIARR